ncbi:hypothetical protein EXIGLDRAFT_707940 [Exidia glandulosa HHB12029]|uniref:Uncharacterized protein n=1 Tax=Exidia glandulosa HHB12029 TaxID=1314781 RepID=A0A166NC29_EXIGL|nr:hypothetical protein EXIGLDRAFT_707940 [Exidia glandulosa HHB12029]
MCRCALLAAQFISFPSFVLSMCLSRPQAHLQGSIHTEKVWMNSGKRLYVNLEMQLGDALLTQDWDVLTAQISEGCRALYSLTPASKRIHDLVTLIGKNERASARYTTIGAQHHTVYSLHIAIDCAKEYLKLEAVKHLADLLKLYSNVGICRMFVNLKHWLLYNGPALTDFIFAPVMLGGKPMYLDIPWIDSIARGVYSAISDYAKARNAAEPTDGGTAPAKSKRRKQVLQQEIEVLDVLPDPDLAPDHDEVLGPVKIEDEFAIPLAMADDDDADDSDNSDYVLSDTNASDDEDERDDGVWGGLLDGPVEADRASATALGTPLATSIRCTFEAFIPAVVAKGKLSISVSSRKHKYNLTFSGGSGLRLYDTLIKAFVQALFNLVLARGLRKVMDNFNIGYKSRSDSLGTLIGRLKPDTTDLQSQFAPPPTRSSAPDASQVDRPRTKCATLKKGLPVHPGARPEDLTSLPDESTLKPVSHMLSLAYKRHKRKLETADAPALASSNKAAECFYTSRNPRSDIGAGTQFTSDQMNPVIAFWSVTDIFCNFFTSDNIHQAPYFMGISMVTEKFFKEWKQEDLQDRVVMFKLYNDRKHQNNLAVVGKLPKKGIYTPSYLRRHSTFVLMENMCMYGTACKDLSFRDGQAISDIWGLELEAWLATFFKDDPSPKTQVTWTEMLCHIQSWGIKSDNLGALHLCNHLAARKMCIPATTTKLDSAYWRIATSAPTGVLFYSVNDIIHTVQMMYNHLDGSLDSKQKEFFCFGTAFLENLLCKVSHTAKLHKRLRLSKTLLVWANAHHSTGHSHSVVVFNWGGRKTCTVYAL